MSGDRLVLLTPLRQALERGVLSAIRSLEEQASKST